MYAVAISVLYFAYQFCGLYWKARTMVVAAINDDFNSVFGHLVGGEKRQAEEECAGVSKKHKGDAEGEREFLRVYETMPAQMLNAYGMAAFATMTQEKVWEDLNKPLKTGAKYMTELCSKAEERRCVGINRMLQTLVEYLKYQKSEGVRAQNRFILKEEIYTQLYREIDMIFDAAVYCLAGKKQYVKKGASGLRTAVSFDPSVKKEEEKLRAYAQNLYQWITLPKSRLRMLINWQMAGGLPYVSGTHLLGVQCFLACGNKYHDGEGDKAVTLQVFQHAIVKRHEMELQGHAYIKSEDNDQDFQ